MFMMATQWPSGAVDQVSLSGLVNVLVHLHCIALILACSCIASITAALSAHLAVLLDNTICSIHATKTASSVVVAVIFLVC